MYSNLEKIKEKKEKKIKEYYKAHLAGSGLDNIAIQTLKDKKFTKKRKLKANPNKKTHKQLKSAHIKDVENQPTNNTQAPQEELPNPK
jgi:hypothetical protein